MISKVFPNIETISIGALHEEVSAQKELTALLGRLDLCRVSLATPHHTIDINALALAATALTDLETLIGSVDMLELLGHQLPFLPRCSVKELTLNVSDATTPGLQSIINSFASQAVDFRLALSSTFLESRDDETSLSPSKLNNILKPFVSSTPKFSLVIKLADKAFARWSILDLPKNRSFVFFLHQPVDEPHFRAVWNVGEVQHVEERVKYMMSRIKTGRGQVQVWARRGRDWDSAGGQVLEVFADGLGAMVKWV